MYTKRNKGVVKEEMTKSARNNMEDIVVLIAAMQDNLTDMKKRLSELELIVK